MPPELGRPERTSMRHAPSSFALRIAQNVSDQRLATLREPHRLILSRVRCIALLALSSQQQVILCVATNPNPNDFSIPLGCQRTMMQAYAS